MKTRTLIIAAASILLLLLPLVFRPEIWADIQRWYRLITDREWIRTTVQSCGWAAPLVFIGIQIGQVIAAPIPGEATGFIGGYIFGALEGFIYSSIGLSAGSLINFAIGRFLGERFVRRLIPARLIQRFDGLTHRQGLIPIFLMYVLPGFPKDYLSLLLGLSTMPSKLFALIATVGRMPGTLLLSLQGASLYDQSYWLLAVVTGACLLLALLAYRFREPLYRWVENMNTPGNSP